MVLKNEIKVDIVIPAYNEEKIIRENVGILTNFLQKNLRCKWRVIVADNASTDNTFGIAEELSKKNVNVKAIHFEKRGRGGALKKIWSQSQADMVGYMDADLSTDLNALPKAIDSVIEEWDLVVGSRLLKEAEVKRGLFREILSRVYNLFIKIFLFTSQFSDAQCGFKVFRREVIERLLPKIKNDNWFFDTELLFQAEKEGFRIKEFPVRWIETPSSKVNIFCAIWEDIRGVLRLSLSSLIERLIQ